MANEPFTMNPKTKVKISRNGVSNGEYELWQIEELMKSGEILTKDHYWYDGMTEWKKISDSYIITESIMAKKTSS